MTYTVQYQIATYSGTVTVNARDTDEAIAKAKAKVSRMTLPLAGIRYESWRVVGASDTTE